jgi:P27 family predicted phage terminase small subunit
MSRPNGRPPVPTELRVLRGHPSHSSPKTRGAKGEIPSAIPGAPDSLGTAGKAAWTLYWQHGRAWLAMTDIPILTQLCETHDEADRLASAIREEGLVHVNDKTGRSFAHHLYNDLRGLRREIRELWSLCYMTPTDRGRANAKPTEVDPLAEWAAQ